MTKREFEEGFAAELFDEEMERQLFQIENRLAADKGRLRLAADTIPGNKIGLGGVVNVFLDAKNE